MNKTTMKQKKKRNYHLSEPSHQASLSHASVANQHHLDKTGVIFMVHNEFDIDNDVNNEVSHTIIANQHHLDHNIDAHFSL